MDDMASMPTLAATEEAIPIHLKAAMLPQAMVEPLDKDMADLTRLQPLLLEDPMEELLDLRW